ncbi:hypothetical protein Y032_0566g19 [Ancylostoma ceylanicum]|uniref:Uncharacterized protein n=1 Tax=Ancylostoma ceylanicum TaxID=53326 RepID=A0A016WNY6_9BILA|nr:hypothetical protein Y032_0566g19 [Ancylostoma ceylanicum]
MRVCKIYEATLAATIFHLKRTGTRLLGNELGRFGQTTKSEGRIHQARVSIAADSIQAAVANKPSNGRCPRQPKISLRRNYIPASAYRAYAHILFAGDHYESS